MIANAVKFSADDGAVDVERWRDDQFAEIVVVDHGVGIKREFLPCSIDSGRRAQRCMASIAERARAESNQRCG